MSAADHARLKKMAATLRELAGQDHPELPAWMSMAAELNRLADEIEADLAILPG